MLFSAHAHDHNYAISESAVPKYCVHLTLGLSKQY